MILRTGSPRLSYYASNTGKKRRLLLGQITCQQNAEHPLLPVQFGCPYPPDSVISHRTHSGLHRKTRYADVAENGRIACMCRLDQAAQHPPARLVSSDNMGTSKGSRCGLNRSSRLDSQVTSLRFILRHASWVTVKTTAPLDCHRQVVVVTAFEVRMWRLYCVFRLL
jgi:hypothetical protein